jgi:serine acetyltransferase
MEDGVFTPRSGAAAAEADAICLYVFSKVPTNSLLERAIQQKNGHHVNPFAKTPRSTLEIGTGSVVTRSTAIGETLALFSGVVAGRPTRHKA